MTTYFCVVVSIGWSAIRCLGRELEVEQDQQRLAGLQLHLEDAPEGGARADA